MGYWWVKSASGGAGTVQADTQSNAMQIYKEKKGNDAYTAERLPYPASPIIHQEECENPCPPFCYRPETCQGKTCCPNNPSCCE